MTINERRFNPVRVAAVLAAVGAAFWLTAAVDAGQSRRSSTSAPYRAPRTAGGQPDFNGIWQALNTANWDLEDHAAEAGPVMAAGAAYATPPGFGVVEGGKIPYKPEALAKKKQNYANRLALDPEIKCFLPGAPRMMYMPYPFQIIQAESHILVASEFASAVRTVYMDQHTEAPADTLMGWANGHYEGESLVVDTTGFMGSSIEALKGTPLYVDTRWLDRAGNYYSDTMHLVERFTRTSADIINYEATIEDPKVYTRPWKIRMPLYRRVDTNMLLGEFKCEEFVQDLLFGQYYKNPPK